MNKFRLSVFAVFSLFLFVTFALAQDKVTIYNDVNFQGANMTIDGNWNECCGFQKNIRSIRVPRGYRVTIYSDKNFKGTQALLTEDWNPGQTAWWVTRIRSIRVEGAPIAPPTQASFPVIYAQANFQGPAMAVERDWAGNRDWDGRPHRIRSIRVPQGWYLVLYEKTNFRGKSYNLNSDWTPMPGDYWYGRIKSIKVYQGSPPIQPR